MKVKEVNALANVAWSPRCVHPTLLACATTAKQMDAALTNSNSLSLYQLNLDSNNLELKPVASVEAPAKFHAVEWNGIGNESSGIIYGGCDNGALYIYDAAKLLANSPNAILGNTKGRHSGPVFTLSSNQLKANFVVCGSSDSEVTVWDTNNLATPIIPGKKLSIGADVSCVEFNRQVEHIFASTCGGHNVVWDLRKHASIMTISDTVSRMKASSMTWHPRVATQLLLTSDDDATPWAQVWDLRYATTPLRTLEGHERGIVKAVWCADDQNLLLTTAKDNKILVWNPNEAQRGMEIVAEFPSYNQWSFDIDWCRRDPSLVAAASVDGCVSVYSVLGAGIPPSQSDKFSQIADSFPGMEMPAVVPQGATPQPIRLRNPPKFFIPKSGANFAFGGRLVQWNSETRSVTIGQVVTEPDLVERSGKLEEALSQQQFSSYCQLKAQNSTSPRDQILWQYISANFEESPRARYMELLGYTNKQVSSRLHPTPDTNTEDGISPQDLADKMASLGTTDGSTGSLDPSEQFEMIASGQSFDKTPETETADGETESEGTVSPGVINLDVKEESEGGKHSGLIRQALLVGDLESAVELCLKDQLYPHAMALAATASQDLFAKSAVELCLKDHLYPHAMALAATASQDLFAKTRDKVLGCVDGGAGAGVGALVGVIVRGDLASIVSTCSLASWKEALTAVLTYSDDAQFPTFAETLGERLENDGGPEALLSALVCYVCAGSLDKFVTCWIKINPQTHKPNQLQDLVEIIMGLQRSLGAAGRNCNLSEGTTVSSLLCQYASLLAAQGALNTAVSYLNSATQGEMVDLRNRLYRALGYNTGGVATSAPSHISAPTRRTSTPHSYHQQPSQFTPSVQDQQRGLYGEPIQSPAFFTPSAAHHPPQMDMGGSGYGVQPPRMTPLTPMTPVATPFQPTPTPQPPQPHMPPPTGPLPTQPAPPTNMRRGPSRYMPEPTRPAMGNPMGVLNPSMPPQPYGAPPLNPNPMTPTPQFFTPSVPQPGPPAGQYSLSQQPPQHQQTPQQSKPPAALDASVPRGWNDPPPLSSSRKAKQQQQQQSTEEVKCPEPILCPVPGGNVPEPPQQFMGFQQPQYGSEAPPSVNPAGTSAPPGALPPQAAPTPEPINKGPLPSEHQVLQNVLDQLKNRCLLVVQNQQMKTRLEDIGTKLEILYDKLRASQLGPHSTGGLHQIVSSAQAGDYRGALNSHAQTIAKGSFSELSAFMPALKLLLQYCMQLQVFLQ